MSGYQPYESPGGIGPAVIPVEDPPVIARMPDLDGGLYTEEFDHPRATLWPFSRRLSRQKTAFAAAAAVVVLFGGWMILGGGSDDDQTAQESWQPAPPAASAPEAPRWEANSESKTDAITLDEVQPRHEASKALPAAFEKIPAEKSDAENVDETAVKVITKPPAGDIRPRVAANRPVVIGTPVPPVEPAECKKDWSTMNSAEYYWAVRRRSEAAMTAGNVQPSDDTARLNGVIETPTARMY